MKIKSVEISSSLKDTLSEIGRSYYLLVSGFYVVSTHHMLSYFTQSAHFCVVKQTNSWMDKQSDYSTLCAHGVTNVDTHNIIHNKMHTQCSLKEEVTQLALNNPLQK